MDTLKQKLTVLLRKHEGNKLQVYPDSEGYPTIGNGRCLTTKGLSKASQEITLLVAIPAAQAPEDYTGTLTFTITQP